MLNTPSLLKDILSLLYKYADIFAIGFEKKRIRLSLIIDLANDSIGSSECRDSTSGDIWGMHSTGTGQPVAKQDGLMILPS